MTCPAIITGDQFLTRVLTHIDCQAAVLGSYGYQALSQPGSLASTLMLGLLTLFIALIGVRFLFGPTPSGRDIVFDVLKIGLVLTMAFSWPAFRTVVHDVVVDGPGEVAAAIAPAQLASEGEQMVSRLQTVDQQIVRLTSQGAGRQTGEILQGSEAGARFSGTGLQDDAAMGYARLFYLSGVLGPFALLRILAGLLLAIAPLAAGLLLFESTRGLFAGWLKGLVLCMLGILGVTVVLSLQLSVVAPWLTDALQVRTLGYGIPSAPTELLAMTLAFAIVQYAIIWLLAKVAFNRGWAAQWLHSGLPRSVATPPVLPHVPEPALAGPAGSHSSRVERISDHVERLVQREQYSSDRSRIAVRTLAQSTDKQTPTSRSDTQRTDQTPRLGSSYRRTYRRDSMAARNRDRSE